jgi:hypothetical protein
MFPLIKVSVLTNMVIRQSVLTWLNLFNIAIKLNSLTLLNHWIKLFVEQILKSGQFN